MDRDFRVILAASGLSTTVTALLYASLQFRALEISGSKFYVGLIGSLPYLGLMIMAYVWGLLSDYLGKRKGIVIVSGIVGSLLFFIYPFLTSIEMLIAVRFVQVCLMGSIILLLAVVTERFPADKGKVIGDLNVPLAAGWVVGAGVAAALYKNPYMSVELSNLIFFTLCGAIGLASSLVLILLHEPKKDRNELSFSSLKEMVRFKNKRPIGVLCTATLVLLTGNYMIYSVFAIYLQEPMFALAEWQIGLIVAGSGLFGMFVFRFAGRLVDNKGRKAVLLPTLAMYAVSWLVYALTTNLYIIAILWVLPYWSFFTTSSTAMVSDLTEDSERGRGIGILNAAINFGNFAGSLLGGLLADVLDYPRTYMVAAALVFIAFLIALNIKETKPVKSPLGDVPLK